MDSDTSIINLPRIKPISDPSARWYLIIVLSGVCDVQSENHSKISGHMTSGEQEFLIPVLAGFWREL